MKKIVNKFPDEFKLKVIEEYISTAKTQNELMLEYNILGHSSIPKWMRKFGISQPTQQQVELQIKMAQEATNKTKREFELETKVKELEKELDLERFRSKALDTMINIIERDLKIPVRKKFGTKQ